MTTEMPQHMKALGRANEIRLQRAQIKRDIRDNDRVLLRVLHDPPSCVMTAAISELLSSQTRWAATRTRKFLQTLSINEHRTVEDLTNRQREAIAAALEARRV
jgi:hypothetical protein